MLILQRKLGEKIYIGDDITVTVTSIDGSRIRLAIEAPKEICILRSELVENKKANKESVMDENSANELLELLNSVEGADNLQTPENTDSRTVSVPGNETGAVTDRKD